MEPAPILLSRTRASRAAFQAWVARAAQARRIAAMVTPKDAAILEAYALECESQASRVMAQQPVAA